MQLWNIIRLPKVTRDLLLKHARVMARFSQVVNPLTGQNTWKECDEDYDYHMEIGNAGFGDMLHDSERNKKYFAAIKKTIAGMRAAGREVHVLDIGTGTGILSMMALQCGADTVTACEAFLPMANCAERILAANNASKVHLIKKRSTEIKVGVDMPQKANLLVTEVLDTELIGEGAIGIYNHAHNELLTDDALAIPARAVCFAQLAESPLGKQFNSLKCLTNLDGEILLHPPKEIMKCPGECFLHDLQLSQVPRNLFNLITHPLEIFQFDFQSKEPIQEQRKAVLSFHAKNSGTIDVVFYWWHIEMDNESEILLSCAPYWAHPDISQLLSTNASNRPIPNRVPWRDHWLQAIYYIPKPLHLRTAGQTFWLSCNHDEYSFWFEAHAEKPSDSATRKNCNCNLHLTYARNRIGQLNQAIRNKRYIRYLEETIAKDSKVLLLGDGCILGLSTLKMGAKSVICYEPHRFSRSFMQSIIRDNKLTNVQLVESLENIKRPNLESLTHIIAEPYFLNSTLPWDNFYFGTLLLKIPQAMRDNVVVSPASARIYALPVEFLDLHKIRQPVQNCEGFDLTLFDDMVENSVNLSHAKVDAQPLWEYPCRALTEPQEILAVDFYNFAVDVESKGIFKLPNSSRICNGIALWVDWQLSSKRTNHSIITTGPIEPVVVNEFVKWDMFVRQGVHFTRLTSPCTHINWNVHFMPIIGTLNFNFTAPQENE